MRRPISQISGRVSLVEGDFTPTTEMQRWMDKVSQNSYSITTQSVTLNPTSVSANTTEEQTFTLEGLNENDVVLDVQKPSHTAGLVIGNYRPSADDTLAVVFGNLTASPIDPPSETYLVTVFRQ